MKSSTQCKSKWVRDFPGGPVAKTLHSNAQNLGSISGQGTRSPPFRIFLHGVRPLRSLPHYNSYPQSSFLWSHLENKTSV